MIARPTSDERGFTLAELLVAITILGIIMAAIGAMITTAFRTTTIVSNRLEGSRAPKLVSTYWIPDVEGARQVIVGGGTGDCPAPSGAATAVLVTFTWTKLPSQTSTDAPPRVDGTEQAATWWRRQYGSRTQIVRVACAGSVVRSTAVVIPDVAAGGVSVSPRETGQDHYRIDVSVPDRNESDQQFHFTVDGTPALLPSTPVSSP